MALVVPNAGELALLNKMLKAPLTTDEDYHLKLYRGNQTPDQNTVGGGLTEADFTDYAAKTLTRSGWNDAVTVSGKAQASYGSAPQSWTCGTSGNTIYGYYVSGATSNVILWAERFPVARVLAEGDVLNLTPTFELNSES